MLCLYLDFVSNPCGWHAESNAELIQKLGKCLRNLEGKSESEILEDMLTQYKETEGRLGDAELIDKKSGNA